MSKSWAAAFLCAVLAFVLFGGWFLALLYAEPGTKLEKCVNALTDIMIVAGVLGIVGVVVYCIYVLIA